MEGDKIKIPNWEVKVECEFCASVYTFGDKELSSMIDNTEVGRVPLSCKCPNCGLTNEVSRMKVKREIRKSLTSDLFY